MKTTILLYTVCLLVLGVVPFQGHCQWKRVNGPGGGIIWTLAVNKQNHIFAGARYSGIFVSRNNGEMWEPVCTGLPISPEVRVLAVNDSRIFAGLDARGVYISTDNGGTWNVSNNGLTNKYIQSFTFIANNVFAGTDSGVFRSTDNGASWKAANSGIPSGKTVNTFLVFNNKLFAACGWASVYRSDDTGKTWTPANNGLPAENSVFALAAKGDSIFAGTQNKGVYLSTDTGMTWTAANTSLSSSSIRALKVFGDTIYAGTDKGIYKTYGNTTEWLKSSYGVSNSIYALAMDDSGNCFAGCGYEGVFRNLGHNSGWEECNTGLTGGYIRAFYRAGNNSLLAATREQGLLQSSDNGDTWKVIGSDDSYQTIHQIFRTANGTLYAQNWLDFLESDDEGTQWSELEIPDINGLIVPFGDILVAASDSGVYVSSDKGATWSLTVNELSGISLHNISVRDGTLYAIADSNRIFFSSDHGNHWTPVQCDTLIKNTIRRLFFRGNTIFAEVDNVGVLKSEDNGMHWTPVNTGMTDRFINQLLLYGNALFAGTMFKGVFLSTDDGTSWISITEGLPNLKVQNLYADDHKIYASTHYGGLWYRPFSDFSGVTVKNDLIKKTMHEHYPVFTVRNGRTIQISYRLMQPGNVSLSIYYPNGRRLHELERGYFQAGDYSLPCDIANTPSGCYTIRLQTSAGCYAKVIPVIR